MQDGKLEGRRVEYRIGRGLCIELGVKKLQNGSSWKLLKAVGVSGSPERSIDGIIILNNSETSKA